MTAGLVPVILAADLRLIIRSKLSPVSIALMTGSEELRRADHTATFCYQLKVRRELIVGPTSPYWTVSVFVFLHRFPAH